MNTANRYGILLGCFAINFFIAGAARLSSIFFVESITRYNVDRKQASFPFVLVYMLRHLSGPVVGYIEQIFGMQRIIITGCVGATISVGACFFAEDILTVAALWGIVLGLSFGCAHHTLPSLLNSYFPGRESTANGIALSGACVGAILLPIVMKVCLNNYGLSGSFLVLSAIISHTIPASFLIKNPKKDIHQFESKVKNTALHDCGKNTYATNFHHAAQHFGHENNIDVFSSEHKQSNFVGENQNLTLHASFEDQVREVKNHCIENQNCNIIDTQNNTLSNVSTDETLRGKCKGKFVSDKNMFSFQNFMIFVDPIYIIILIINFGGMALAVTVWTIILDFVRDKNVGEHLEIYYVVLLPLSDLMGRFGSGFVLDKNFLSKPNTTLEQYFFYK